MKREEERIKTLFQQLREEDERYAPSFAHDWKAALSRQEKLRHQGSAWRLAVAALLLVVGAACAGWWMFSGQSTMRQAQVETVRSEPPPADVAPQPVSPAPTQIENPRYATGRQRTFVRPQPTASLISQWRSPTQSLLRVPGEQLLKRVPRLDESSVNIKATIPDQKN
jgi:hypothetical protein